METTKDFEPFLLGNTPYHLLPHSKAAQLPQQIPGLDKLDTDLIPFTFIPWAKRSFDEHDLKSICERFFVEDDVWCHDFTSCEPTGASYSKE